MANKYFYHVVYEPGFVNYAGSNTDETFYWELEPEKILEVPNRTTVTFELNDLPLTKKFIQAYKEKMYAVTYDQLVRGRKSSWRMIYDVYKGLTTKDVLASRTEMNCIIEWLNTDFQDKIWFTIPSELKLNEIDIHDKRENNLNELHDHFETRMVELESKVAKGEIEDESIHKILWDKLQSINLLVHYNERLGNEYNIEELDKQDPTYFTSLKFDVPERTEWKLQPEDYEHFTMVRSSNALTLDFGTVGKDLFTCSVTEDQELVYKNMISQQWELNPWVQYDFTACTKEEWETDQMLIYNKWLEENKIGDYLDLSDPKYTPGRHQLGECISHNFTCGKDFIDQVITDTPRIYGFFITDENNKSIL
jgi:hypothetical protein